MVLESSDFVHLDDILCCSFELITYKLLHLRTKQCQNVTAVRLDGARFLTCLILDTVKIRCRYILGQIIFVGIVR